MITHANHYTLAVTDIERSFNFYKNILGLKPLCKWPKGAYFLAGDFWFCLNLDSNRKPEPDAHYTHFAFGAPYVRIVVASSSGKNYKGGLVEMNDEIFNRSRQKNDCREGA